MKKSEKLRIGKHENKDSGIFIFGDSKEKALIRIFPHEDQDQYANKMVHAYNHHDTLVSLIKECQGGIYPKLQEKIQQVLDQIEKIQE